ncbi:sigma-54 interaction domain-containing protein [Alteribacter natronophilus]|uniref:sigma-54 interaction domain-containing protein n=1 Tax=Alteribacter natronophilus TaxID=2583810 RepID=UPI00110E3B0E|nr:sigma 54-interacting transcriptional regulator [Alteribacter natronophilus]TMW73508.1 PAS domain-containing protein [Alteribacter natronophilus]
MFADHFDNDDMINAILEGIDEGIHAVDREGITVYYNRIAAEHDGLEVSEVLGKPLLEVFPSLSAHTSTLLQVMEKGEPIYNQPQSYRNVKGKLIDTVNTTIPLYADNTIIGSLEIAKDLSRVKDLSLKLLELQAKADDRSAKARKISGNERLFTFDHIITASASVKDLIQKAEKISHTTSPVFVYGETGTGKELLVQAIHNASPRRHQPFISQNCAAIPSSLLESILFGTARGSFTGAVEREGFFELAHGGTLFLDEIHTLPLDLQAKLLRVLEDGVVRRVGSSGSYMTDVRIITASNENPEDLLADKKIRPDLYYRLNVVSMRLPSLRERKNDIPILARHFISMFNYRFNRLVTGASKEAEEALMQWNWPGNIRELKHAIESAMNIAEGDLIEAGDLPPFLLDGYGRAASVQSRSLKEAVSEHEKVLIEKALRETDHNVKKAAALLQVPRQTLQYKITKYRLQ